MSGRDPARDRLAADLERLAALDLAGLRRRWRRLFGNSAPGHLPRSLLHRILAYRVQADAMGDLNRDTARELRRMAEEGMGAEVMPLPELRPVKPGTLLVREWDGALQRVMVLVDAVPPNRSLAGPSLFNRENTGKPDRLRPMTSIPVGVP